MRRMAKAVIITNKFNPFTAVISIDLNSYFFRIQRYSRTLGYLAQLKIMECKYEHDYCHYTEEHPYSGQSIAIDAQKVPKGVPKEFWKEPIEQAFVQMDDWFLEHEYTPTSYIEKHTTCDALHEGQMLPTSHFTTAVVEDNYEFGCAIMLYKEHFIDANEKEPKNKEKTKYYNHLVCDFAATNLMNQTTAHYSKGGENGKAAEGCTTGPDSYYKGLCSDAENYKDGERHREPTKPFPESPLKGNAPIVIEIPPKFKEILKTIPRGTGEKNPAVKSPVASQPATKTPPKEEPTRSPPVLNKPVASQPVPKTAPKVVPTKPSPQKKNGLFGLCKSGK